MIQAHCVVLLRMVAQQVYLQLLRDVISRIGQTWAYLFYHKSCLVPKLKLHPGSTKERIFILKTLERIFLGIQYSYYFEPQNLNDMLNPYFCPQIQSLYVC